MSESMAMGGSRETEYLTALASEPEDATTSSPPFFSASSESMPERTESGELRSIEEQIEQSMSHWSEVSKPDSNFMDEEVEAAAISNREVFKSLQLHPTLGSFFLTFGEGEVDAGEDEVDAGEDDLGKLVVGKKFAAGGQAELYEAQIKWRYQRYIENDLKYGTEYVLKVFRKGTFLQQLQSQWPEGLLQHRVEIEEISRSSTPERMPNRYICSVFGGILLKDGRFAFLLQREKEDLRSCIDRIMLKTGHDSGPFPKQMVEYLMYRVARGMDWLHRRNIVHRDLKASNLLFTRKRNGRWACYVADFECSIGVVGTGFFRAPEILQAVKDKTVSQRPELFTKEGDVYGYGMTCYEILTGKLPFEGHPTNDYDLVLKGQRPELPEYVDDWICELVSRCWQSNPSSRPCFGEILSLLVANSPTIREGISMEDFGDLASAAPH